jgi:hypothetical protein
MSEGDNVEVIAEVPVHYHGEYELSVANGYERIFEEDRHDSEHVEGLDSDPGTTTALYAVASARYLADKTANLGAVSPARASAWRTSTTRRTRSAPLC